MNFIQFPEIGRHMKRQNLIKVLKLKLMENHKNVSKEINRNSLNQRDF